MWNDSIFVSNGSPYKSCMHRNCTSDVPLHYTTLHYKDIKRIDGVSDYRKFSLEKIAIFIYFDDKNTKSNTDMDWLSHNARNVRFQLPRNLAAYVRDKISIHV